MTPVGLRVLIVEDEGLVAMVLEDYLADLGHVVAAVVSRLEDGMEAAQTALFDVAVLDINLAGKVSYPIAEVLRSRGIPFMFATGYGNAGIPVKYKSTPVIAKPFMQTDLAAALEATGANSLPH